MKNKEETCPHCGYCKHCGRGGHQVVPFYPQPLYPYYPQPWWGQTYIYSKGISGTLTVGGTTSSAVSLEA